MRRLLVFLIGLLAGLIFAAVEASGSFTGVRGDGSTFHSTGETAVGLDGSFNDVYRSEWDSEPIYSPRITTKRPDDAPTDTPLYYSWTQPPSAPLLSNDGATPVPEPKFPWLIVLIVVLVLVGRRLIP